ncbi:Na/Pi cotransporter family protein [Aureimonas sp. AU12]|uniref:Na/Pi cotransporter family protein n=1 Tax=Aureimonas sp. AU12 TaxID=1638161 RepID=UPI000781B03C|nr:Na/Pi cotransporter family protein [Aureimonas sp. AU12]
MSATTILIHLLGEIALLLWGIRMVSGGMQRALGNRLTAVLGIGLKTRFRAVLAGLGLTALLQSSTATAMMTSAFTAGGLVDLVPALAVMLGANIGTTLIVQLASFDVSALYPLLLLAGLVASRSGRSSSWREAGTALVGLGLVLLALHLLVATMAPLEHAPAFRALIAAVTGDPLVALVLAALLAWAAHSSVAAMLFVMSLAGAGIVEPQAAIVMVIGTNLGSALNPVVAQLGGDPTRLRLPLGNLLNRGIGAALLLPFAGPIAGALLTLDPSPARAAASFHLLFNIATALLFFGLLPLQARLLRRLLPEQRAARDPGAPQYLDDAALGTPSVALSNAAREVLRMADVIEEMLRDARDAFHHDDADRITATRRKDDILDRLFRAIQRYLGAIGGQPLGEDEARRLSDTLALAINLEHVGDIIDRNLMDLATRRIRSGLRLADDAVAEVDAMHGKLLDHLQLAVTVFMVADQDAARRLVEEKEAFRDVERATTQRHMRLMRGGDRRAVEASALQLDIIRDLKRIEAHIASTVYGLLEQAGQLRQSRLRAEV